MAAPIPAASTPYGQIRSSRRRAASPRIGTSGYMAIRWYQHSLHGTKWATSDRYRLPRVQTKATAKASSRAEGPMAADASRRHPAAAGDHRAARFRTTAATTASSAATARRARNSVTVGVDMSDPVSEAKGWLLGAETPRSAAERP